MINDLESLDFIYNRMLALCHLFNTILIFFKVFFVFFFFLDLLTQYAFYWKELLLEFIKVIINLFKLELKSSLIEGILHILDVFQLLSAQIAYFRESLFDKVSQGFGEVAFPIYSFKCSNAKGQWRYCVFCLIKFKVKLLEVI